MPRVEQTWLGHIKSEALARSVADGLKFTEGLVAAFVGEAEHPNEPVGSPLWTTDHPFDVEEPSGWQSFGNDALSIEVDATAPLSPSNIGAVVFPEGFVGGSAPHNLALDAQTRAARLYMHFAFKVSANWYGHDVANVTKIGFVTNGSHDDFYFTVSGGGAAALYFEVFTQGVAGGGDRYFENLAEGANLITRSEWIDVEILLTADSDDTAEDGHIEIWCNGVKTHDYDNVSLTRAGDTPGWTTLSWQPTYGGGSAASVPAEQFQYMDHIYVSGWAA